MPPAGTSGFGMERTGGVSAWLRWRPGHPLPSARQAEQAWDLEALAGSDREETAGRLREWLLTSLNGVSFGASSATASPLRWLGRLDPDTD